MKNLIPQLIHNNFYSNELKGNFNAITMFMDISGFTPMTERLMKEGKEGAEVLSDILNRVFTPVIDAVYDRGGFISGFAGDAFTAIFPDVKKSLSALYSAEHINQIFNENALQKTRFGEFPLYVKLGLSYGYVDWGISGSESHKTYYFRGQAIDGCAKSEHHCDKMDIVLDNALLNRFDKEITTTDIDNDYALLDSINVKGDDKTPIRTNPYSKNVLSKFLPQSVIDFTQQGEFRNIVSVFISFQNIETIEQLDKFITYTIDNVYKYGGYFNSLDFGDKGGTVLVFFGAPISYENDKERAINFINTIRTEFKDNIRAGIVSGIVYAGLVGSDIRCAYTCLGDTVNLSARFMMKAGFGDVWLSENINNHLQNLYNTKNINKHKFKGKSDKIQVYKLLTKKQKVESKLYEGDMVGREKELSLLRERIKPLYKNKFGGVVNIYGEAGMGKSRLLYELTKGVEDDIDTFILQSDSILKKSLNPFTYLFNDYFKQSQAHNDEEKKKNFEKVYDELIYNIENINAININSV